MDEITNSTLISAAMGILTYAGDARIHAKKALQAIQSFDFTLAQSELAQASQNITEAHKAQTEITQDTLMTINSEVELIKELIKTFKIFAEAIHAEVK